MLFQTVINIWTNELNKNKTKTRRDSQQNIASNNNQNINAGNAVNINAVTSNGINNLQTSNQKFGNARSTVKISSAGLGHEGKYTPNSSVQTKFTNLSMNSSTEQAQMIVPKMQYLPQSNAMLYKGNSNQNDLHLPITSNVTSNKINNSHGNYVEIDTIDQILYNNNRDKDNNYNKQPIPYPKIDRKFSLNQNHMHTFENQPMRNVNQYLINKNGGNNNSSVSNLSGSNNNNLNSNDTNMGKLYAIKNSTNDLQQSQKQLNILPSNISYNNANINSNNNKLENYPIYENQSQLSAIVAVRSESPIYSNTTLNTPGPTAGINPQSMNSIYQNYNNNSNNNNSNNDANFYTNIRARSGNNTRLDYFNFGGQPLYSNIMNDLSNANGMTYGEQLMHNARHGHNVISQGENLYHIQQNSFNIFFVCFGICSSCHTTNY